MDMNEEKLATAEGIFGIFNFNSSPSGEEDSSNSDPDANPFAKPNEPDEDGINNPFEPDEPDNSETNNPFDPDAGDNADDESNPDSDPIPGLFSGLFGSNDTQQNEDQIADDSDDDDESLDDEENDKDSENPEDFVDTPGIKDDESETPEIDFFTGPALNGDFDDDGQDDDVITGNEDSETIASGSGNDTIDGGEGDDNLDGGEGDDDLIGGAGNDILNAGHGTDSLTGGEGNDTFNFYAAGQFVIKDFDTSSDKINFDADETGLSSIEELLEAIENIEETEDGVTVHFVNDIASITLIGLQADDLSADMVTFF